MKIWVRVTDDDWFEYLRARHPDEVNFWQPGGQRGFGSPGPDELFLFKLHSPRNIIVGGGFFLRYSALPCSLAWEAFGEKNGVGSYAELLARVHKYRAHHGAADRREPDPTIGCNVLTQPFFLPDSSWLPVPRDWSPHTVQGKAYDLAVEDGKALWNAIQKRAMMLGIWNPGDVDYDTVLREPRYLVRGRFGQGAFRVLVTDAYQRRCAITGERTLPVLEAAHIRPYADQGPNVAGNGLLLRADLHKLFDAGYVTVTPQYRIEVSGRIREEYENGHEYYAYHGQPLQILPESADSRPARQFLVWHNEHRFVT